MYGRMKCLGRFTEVCEHASHLLQNARETGMKDDDRIQGYNDIQQWPNQVAEHATRTELPAQYRKEGVAFPPHRLSSVIQPASSSGRRTQREEKGTYLKRPR